MEKIYGFVTIDLREGQEDAFITAARACHEAIQPDMTGTQLYEWYLSADRRRGYVIEVYDDSEAVLLHGRMLEGRVATVLQYARLAITFAGDVPEPMRERMRSRLGDVSYFGARAHGLMTDPTPHRTPPAGDERICAIAWFTPRANRQNTLCALAREAFEQARDNDPGTLGYEWFFDATGNCMALDVYRDADAMLAHMRGCGQIMNRILEVADSRTIVLGALPPDVEARLRPELGVTRFPHRLHGIA